ncbi:1-aminocyclopropane-1-carboxylate oxidase-like isoform X2 [Styela clava]|uniref:1-aminocyclopropane-1-carboxylate oxidase-like n=1 Tax=Styela clava TaxID=7725 RepID=UPI00193A22BE|nr:1-aminocyclopropane-1-carboxylate oxidase-like [Styela clava]
MKLPVIDFASCAIRNKNVSPKDLKYVGDSIVKAFHSAGFVYLKDTGVSENDLEKVYKSAKQFFDLPIEKKKEYNINKDCFGYIGVGVERNSAQ